MNRPLRVFLCHSSNDKPAVRELYQKLRAEPWIQPWLDEEELFPGMDWNMEIEKAVEAADAIIVCLSKGSINKEGYVQKEIKTALDFADYKPDSTVFIIPVRLEDCKPPVRLAKWQYADYFPAEHRGFAFEKLCKALDLRFKQKNYLGENDTNLNSFASTISQKSSITRPLVISLEESVYGATKNVKYDIYYTCWTCVGSGIKNEAPCTVCRGSGMVNGVRVVNVKIPPGIKTGSEVKVYLNKSQPDGSSGYLCLIISIAQHPFFKIVNSELYMEYPITNQLAQTGGTIKIPLFGKGKLISMEIPRGVRNEQVFHIGKHGIDSGSFFIKVIFYDPENISLDTQKILTEIENYQV